MKPIISLILIILTTTSCNNEEMKKFIHFKKDNINAFLSVDITMDFKADKGIISISNNNMNDIFVFNTVNHNSSSNYQPYSLVFRVFRNNGKNIELPGFTGTSENGYNFSIAKDIFSLATAYKLEAKKNAILEFNTPIIEYAINEVKTSTKANSIQFVFRLYRFEPSAEAHAAVVRNSPKYSIIEIESPVYTFKELLLY